MLMRLKVNEYDVLAKIDNYSFGHGLVEKISENTTESATLALISSCLMQ